LQVLETKTGFLLLVTSAAPTPKTARKTGKKTLAEGLFIPLGLVFPAF